MSRARELGIPLDGTPGPWNAITDVAGVEVGVATVIEGADVRTGVTAIHPRGKDDPGDPCAAGLHVLNGNGEMTGAAWVAESGTVSLPITLTNTHAVGVAHAATCEWVARRFPDLAEGWLLPVAAETWDGYLNDINGGHVTFETVHAALDAATAGPVAEGGVGGGTGMCCYHFKGGNGSASRVVELGDDRYTVGVQVQANFGGRSELVVAGVPVGRELADDDPMADVDTWLAPPGTGSVIAIVATDAPLLPGQCAALARRVPLGLARTGTTGSHFSGDLFLAFSTASPGAFATGVTGLRAGSRGEVSSLRFLQWGAVDALFAAVVQATEEAVLNALAAGRDVVGYRGRRVPGLPAERVSALLRERLR